MAALVATTIISFSALLSPPSLQHQGIVVGEERPELVRSAREHQEHVGDEAGLGAHRLDALAQIGGQVLERAGPSKLLIGGSAIAAASVAIRPPLSASS